jgi:pyridoxal phosphate enzyme (YggS family)
MSTLRDRFGDIQDRITAAAERSGRHAAAVQLVAVSKSHPPEILREAIEAGVVVFGENRIQEARMKIPLLPRSTRWHFIGHLQSNKVRQALSFFELLHGVDSLSIARDIDRIAGELGLYPRVLLEVNVAGEGTKFGFTPDALRRQIEELVQLGRLEIAGLMAIPPPAAEAEDSRSYFLRLRELRDVLQAEARIGLPELSMGMSGDFEVAVEEGATIVRVGSALFGERFGKQWRPVGTDFLDA